MAWLTRLLAERAHGISRFGKWWMCARSTRAIGVSHATRPHTHPSHPSLKRSGQGTGRFESLFPARSPADSPLMGLNSRSYNGAMLIAITRIL